MKIGVFPSDQAGVGFYRLIQPALQLQDTEADIEIQLMGVLPMRLDRQLNPVSVSARFDADVLVMQRPTAAWQLTALRDLQARGVRVVVDIDDDFHSLHHSNPVFWETHPKAKTGESRSVLRAALREADHVTCATPALARRYGAHGRVSVLPNCIPAEWLDLPVDHEPGVVGWTGTLATHRGDLAVTRGGVAQALAETPGSAFRLIGNPKGVQAELGLSEPPQVVKWQSLEDYPIEIGRLDVGIAPLADTKFNAAKSALKPLEQSARGVPCVMSPTAEYVRLHHEHGIGVLAGWRSREWRREVRRLLTDRSWHSEVAERSRAGAAELTIDKHAWRWLEVWCDTARVA